MLDIIRRSKLAYQAYNFLRKKDLEHNVPLYRKWGLNKKYYSSVSSRDFAHLDSPKNKYDKLDSATELANDPKFQSLDPAYRDHLLSWSEDGYIIIPGFYSSDKVEAINDEVDNLIKTKQARWKYGKKIMFAIHYSEHIASIGNDPELIAVLETLMGKEVELFQSINFIEGSEQKAHSDSYHMTTFPFGNLIAVWIALEDISEGSGELHYYPGSHKLPYVMNPDFGNESSGLMLGNKKYSDYTDKVQSLADTHGLQKKTFLAKKGDILIWHANLLHGGEPITKEGSTRKSMVFHYYTKDAICYHEISERPTLKPPLTSP